MHTIDISYTSLAVGLFLLLVGLASEAGAAEIEGIEALAAVAV